MNLALLSKWWRRCKTQSDHLWAKDSWLPGGPLRYQFPPLYDIVRLKLAIVLDCTRSVHNATVWEGRWYRSSQTVQEIEEMASLTQILASTSLNDNQDSWYWEDDKDQEFTVKLIRRTLGRNLDLNQSVEGFEWNRMTSLKVNTFVWRALKNKIPSLECYTIFSKDY